ncbi:MAG: phosphoenolpyruvate kinase [Acidobacteriia bacterium]|nr:phosphoenolpyruvate kinase [Terriglobia bacterium]
MKTSLTDSTIRGALATLEEANVSFSRRYPGETGRRQPVHSVYGGAHLFHAGMARKLGDIALATLEEYAPDAFTFARIIGLPGTETLPKPGKQGAAAKRFAKSPEKLRQENRAAWLALTVYALVREKLRREPVEDFHIDFEDGYGNRPDAEEDHHAILAAGEVARGFQENSLPPFIGIRIKPFSAELSARSIRTLDLFLSALCEATGGRLPQNFVVTLPKVTIPEQTAALAKLLETTEPALGLEKGALKFEIMIETTQAVLNHRGESALPRLLEASAGRCTAAIFGTYDYTASCSITAAYQTMGHPACDFAKHMMQVAFAGTGIWLSDGATNILPAAPHRAEKGKRLTPAQKKENRDVVHRAWRMHYADIQHSLATAYYQGWDLHPAQLPTRYAAVFSFFLEGLDSAAARLKNFVEKAAKATLVGEVFDDAATGQGLLNYFLRAINCGAISEAEAQRLTGVTPEELHMGSFLRILKNRTK